MMNLFYSLVFTLFLKSAQPAAPVTPKILYTKEYSLADRYGDRMVNQVFSDNILLTLAYMSGKIKPGEKVEWDKIRAPAEYKVVLKTGQTFAFHDGVSDKYQAKVAVTSKSHFNALEGFRSDGWLTGDGVCHLASFMNVVAKAAGLEVEAPTRHDFAAIPEVPREKGVSIYYSPGDTASNSRQNLYITNTFAKPIAFVFVHKGDALKINVQEYN